jgi:hypothetical protein
LLTVHVLLVNPRTLLFEGVEETPAGEGQWAPKHT